MRGLFNFIITPKGKRYNNTTNVNGTDLILNSSIEDHLMINRTGVVKALPKLGKTEIQVGNEVILHHNVFRRWYNQYGDEKNSRSFIDENTYCVQDDQIFLYKNKNKWLAPSDYCFVKPIKPYSSTTTDTEQPLVGILKYSNKSLDNIGVTENTLVGFSPNSKFEFIIERERLYRVLTNSITIKYEYQGNEEEYNPSWLQSS